LICSHTKLKKLCAIIQVQPIYPTRAYWTYKMYCSGILGYLSQVYLSVVGRDVLFLPSDLCFINNPYLGIFKSLYGEV